MFALSLISGRSRKESSGVCPNGGQRPRSPSRPFFVLRCLSCSHGELDPRYLPCHLAGELALIEGTLSIVEVFEEKARHYKEDAGTSKEDIAKIVVPQTSVRMSAPAARITGV